MKLYNFTLAPNGRRVKIFLKYKNKEIPEQEINVRDGEQFNEPFKSMNPFNCVPFLHLDDGTVISESISICRYLEEEHFPDPNLFGSTPKMRAYIDMWNRRLELDGYSPLGNAIRNKSSFFVNRVLAGTRNDIKQMPEIVERGIQMIELLFQRIDKHLEKNIFICGDQFTIADITGYSIFKSCELLKFEIPKSLPNTIRWRNTLYTQDCFDV